MHYDKCPSICPGVLLAGSVLIKDHHGKWNSQPDGFFRTDKYTGVTVPAFLGIGHFGLLPFDRSEIDITLTGFSTLQTTGT
jgi:hypothetical protein